MTWGSKLPFQQFLTVSRSHLMVPLSPPFCSPCLGFSSCYLPSLGNVCSHTSISYPSSVDNFKTCLVSQSFLVFPFTPSLTPLSVNVEMISIFTELSYISSLSMSLMFTFYLIDFLLVFHFLHCKFLENKIQSDLS